MYNHEATAIMPRNLTDFDILGPSKCNQGSTLGSRQWTSSSDIPRPKPSLCRLEAKTKVNLRTIATPRLSIQKCAAILSSVHWRGTHGSRLIIVMRISHGTCELSVVHQTTRGEHQRRIYTLVSNVWTLCFILTCSEIKRQLQRKIRQTQV